MKETPPQSLVEHRRSAVRSKIKKTFPFLAGNENKNQTFDGRTINLPFLETIVDAYFGGPEVIG